MPEQSLMGTLGLTTNKDQVHNEVKQLNKKAKLERKNRTKANKLEYFHAAGFESMGDKYNSYKEMYPPGTRMKHFDYFGTLLKIIMGKPVSPPKHAGEKHRLMASPTSSDIFWIIGGFFNGT